MWDPVAEISISRYNVILFCVGEGGTGVHWGHEHPEVSKVEKYIVLFLLITIHYRYHEALIISSTL